MPYIPTFSGVIRLLNMSLEGRKDEQNTYMNRIMTSIQLKLKVVVGVCNYVIFLANIF